MFMNIKNSIILSIIKHSLSLHLFKTFILSFENSVDQMPTNQDQHCISMLRNNDSILMTNYVLLKDVNILFTTLIVLAVLIWYNEFCII